MKIVVALTCLIALAVLGVVTGFSEQEIGDANQNHVKEESRIGIQARYGACKKLGGACINKNIDCPSSWPLETRPGRPWCSKRRKCCYPGCVFGGKVYPDQAVNKETCVDLLCNKGVWEKQGDIKDECGYCRVYGDPHIITYDPHRFSNDIYKTEYVSSGYNGTFVISQDGITPVPSAFGVYAKFIPCENAETCVSIVNYKQPGIEVELILPAKLNDSTYCQTATPNDPECATQVWVNGNTVDDTIKISQFSGTEGTVLIFIPAPCTSALCLIYVVGSNGLTVRLEVNPFFNDGEFYQLDIHPMPSLQNKLYGLCDKFIGALQFNYTLQDGSLMTVWNDENLDKFILSWEDDGCGGNKCCPDCDFSGQGYPHGSTQVLSCMKFKCIKGDWQYTGKVDTKHCGECQVFGDPQFLTYDDHKKQNTRDPNNWYHYNEHEGNFTVTQSGLGDLTVLSVTSYFQSEPNYPAGTWGYTAARTVCYWEIDITICVLLPSFELYQCYNSSHPGEYPECDIKVTVNGYPWIIGKHIQVFNALAGNVLVFDHNHHGIIIDPYGNNGTAADNSRCINIVGSMGLSVSFCTSYNNDGMGAGSIMSIYSHLYVWAMPSLKDHLYGMCDTYTGTTRDGYTMYNGIVTNGTTYDDINEFALTWMIDGAPINKPNVSRCTNSTELTNVEAQCKSITEGVCTNSPPKCAGFISACEFDMCRVSDTADYAQGYANHFKIETHLNE